MTFTLETWREKAAERLHKIGYWLERRKSQDAPCLLYGALCGLSLWPPIAAHLTIDLITGLRLARTLLPSTPSA